MQLLSPVRTTRVFALPASLLLVVGLTGPAAAAVVRTPTGACARATDLNAGAIAKSSTEALRGVRIPSRHGTVHALPFGSTPVPVGSRFKVVWRVTGRGPLRVTLQSPDGGRKPIEGPTPHTASNFVGPGQEWGTVFVFDAPGCWTIGLRRTGAAAMVRVTAV